MIVFLSLRQTLTSKKLKKIEATEHFFHTGIYWNHTLFEDVQHVVLLQAEGKVVRTLTQYLNLIMIPIRDLILFNHIRELGIPTSAPQRCLTL